MPDVYYITPTQYKVLETLIYEEDGDDKLSASHSIAAKKLGITIRTLSTHIREIQSQVNTTNKYKIARLFLENKFIAIDKGKEVYRWRKIQIQRQDLSGKAAF